MPVSRLKPHQRLRMEARLPQKLSKQERQPVLADLKRVQTLLKVLEKAEESPIQVGLMSRCD